MIKVEIKQTDLDELGRDLDNLMPKKLLNRRLDPLGRSIISEVSDYPPPLRTSRRTGELGKSWVYNVMDMNLEVENYATYAGWVQGENQTSRHRRTGWKRLFDVAVSQADKMIVTISREIDRIWRT